MKIFRSRDEILAAVGNTLGTSEWTTITQDQIDKFAEATGDHQWIHVDVDRANDVSPFGGPIAHGYLSLSLLPMLGWQIFKNEGAKIGINYGANRIRFPSPVPVDSRVRLTALLRAAEPLPDGSLQLTVEQTLEIEGTPKPAVVAETLSRVMF